MWKFVLELCKGQCNKTTGHQVISRTADMNIGFEALHGEVSMYVCGNTMCVSTCQVDVVL